MAYRLYGQHCIIGSYNGGKDAVVIFHLMRAVHAKYCQSLIDEANEANNNNDKEEVMISRPRVIYFQHNDEFPEVLSLLDETVKQYDVDMLAFKEGVSFGEGLKYLVDRNVAPGRYDGLSYYGNNNGEQQQQLTQTTIPPPPPHPLAFVLGTRKNDPNAGSQGIYAPSSHYMPPFLRVNPILDWTYGNVWYFLRTFNLPYCTLYDDGYTSLGTVKDTLPCPVLKKKKDGDNNEEYWPAYMLEDWDQERAGRIKKEKKNEPAAQKEEVAKEEEMINEKLRVTMSQTSSTVSFGVNDMTKTISTIMNIDEDNNVAADTNGQSRQMSSLSRPTVGLVVIGDELLKGMTPDSNIISAAKALRSNNITLSRVSIISDDRQDIIDEVQRFTKEVDVIITSGGVGPTHDDVTIKSVAEALGLDLALNDEMA